MRNSKTLHLFIGFGALLGTILFQGCTQKVPDDLNLSGHPVLLVSIDTCRIDFLEPYGTSKVETPTLKALAHDGFIFRNATTPTPLTVPAHASLFTGLHPIRHGVRDNFKSILGEPAVTLAELYSESGYATAGMIGSIILSHRSGFGQGFGFYDDTFTMDEFRAVQPTVEKRGERIAESAKHWLDQHLSQNHSKPFFLFTHFYDPHMMYQPPEPFLTQYRQKPYAGEIAYVDHILGTLFDYLKETGLYDDMFIIVVTDHGEGLGDHQERTHGLFLYEETIRTALIIKPPKNSGLLTGREIQQTASILDVVPTLIELSGLGPIDHDGISLVPWMKEDQALMDRQTVHETQYPLTYNWSPIFALRDQHFKYVHAPQAELYDLQNDSLETSNLVADQKETAARYQAALEKRLTAYAQKRGNFSLDHISTQQSEILASLGYAAGGSESMDSPDNSRPDAKDKIDVYNMVDKGLTMLAQGRYIKAVELFDEAAKLDPNNPTPFFNLSVTYYQTGEWDKAIENIQKALTRAPTHILMHLQLAKIYLASGKRDLAREKLTAIIAEKPNLAEAHFQLGQLSLQENNYGEALRHFQDAKQRMPDMPGIDQLIQKTHAQR